MEKKKKVIALVPSYIGQLIFFEKLSTNIINFDFTFIFLPEPDTKNKRNKIMKNYCDTKKIKYSELEIKPRNIKIFNRLIPFYHPIKNIFLYRKNILKYFNNNKINKIILLNDANLLHKILINCAIKNNVEPLLMQWALTHDSIENIRNKNKKIIIDTYYKVLNFLIYIIFYKKKRKEKKINIIGSGDSKKFGVINNVASELYEKHGVDKKKMEIIGHIDFHVAEKRKNYLDKNKKERCYIKNKLGIPDNKIIITIFSTPFYTKDLNIISALEQKNYYKKIILLIKNSYIEKNLEILFKLHPVEIIDVYNEFKDLGVKIYGNDTNNQDLIYFTDLYIAHHSTTNYQAIIMNKNAIFINFLKLELIEKTKKYFGIYKYIRDYNEFNKLIIDFKKNKLNKQYKYTDKIIPANSLLKINNWIN